MENKSQIKVLRFFGDQEDLEIDEMAVATDVIANYDHALNDRRKWREYPSKSYYLLLDNDGYFVGSEIVCWAWRCCEYWNHDEVEFCVGRILKDGRVVLIRFVQPDPKRYWTSLTFLSRLKLRWILRRYNTTIIQKDRIVWDSERRWLIEISDLDSFAGYSKAELRNERVVLPPEDEAIEENKSEWWTREVKQLILKNFERLPKTGCKIMSKSKDIIDKAIVADDTK